MRRMKKRSRWIKGVVSLAFFFVLFRLVQANDLVSMLRQWDPLYFVLALVMSPVMIFVSCLKWKALLDLQGTPVGVWRLFRIYFIGYYFSNILPSNVGGDVVRSYYAGRQIGSQSLAAVSVFMERVTGLVLLLVLVILLPLFRAGLYRRPAIWVPALGAGAGLVLLLWLVRFTRPLTAVFGLLHGLFARLRGRSGGGAVARALTRAERLCENLKGKADRFHDKLQGVAGILQRNPLALLRVVGLTVFFYALTWVNVYLAFRAFRVEPSLLTVAVVLPTAMSVAMVPITLGSLGIAESSYVFYFGLLGIDPAATLVMGLFLRLKMILSGLVGLVCYTTYPEGKVQHVAEFERARS